MALFLKQDSDRSELQKRLETELQEKLRKKADLENKLPDGVEDSLYMEGKKSTNSYVWVWILLLGAFLLLSLWIIVS